MQYGLPVVPAPCVDSSRDFEQAAVAPGLVHFKPGVANVRGTEILGEAPFDALRRRKARVVQDVVARSFETRPAGMEARNH